MQLFTQALSMLTRGPLGRTDPEQDARLASLAKRRLAIAALPLGLALVARGLFALDRLVAERVAQLGELEQLLAAAAAGATDPSPSAPVPEGEAAAEGDGTSDQGGPSGVYEHHEDPWAHLTPAPLEDISAPVAP